MPLTVIGVDPGPSTGIVELLCGGESCLPGRIVQCNGAAVVPVLDAFITLNPATEERSLVLAVERFMPGRYSGKTPGRATQYLIHQIRDRFGNLPGVRWANLSAGQVKPWANDERLQRVGLLAPTKGMTHARDAARHALYVAVANGVVDPLSKRAFERATGLTVVDV